MDLHTITAPPQSYFVEEKISAARMDQLVTALLQGAQHTNGCVGNKVRAPSAPAHHSAPAAPAGREDGGAQK